MRQRTALFIENPAAGATWRNRRQVAKLKTALRLRHYDLHVVRTTKRGEAAEAVKRRANDAEAIVCCGGDGTLHEVVNGLLAIGLSLPIFYLPVGTTNDTARSLELTQLTAPFTDWLDHGQARELDAGIFNGSLGMVYSATFGACSEVAYKTPQRAKNLLGGLAYWLYSPRCLPTFRPYHGVVHADDETFQGPFLLGCISNSRSMAGLIRFAPDQVDLADGLLELTLIPYPSSRLGLSTVVAEIMSGRLPQGMHTLTHAKDIRVQLEMPTEWGVDGEFAGMHTDVHITACPRAFCIVTLPDKRDGSFCPKTDPVN